MRRAARGLLVNWLDLAQGAGPSFEDWHNREHAAERVGLPGFLRCRRYVSAEACPTPGFSRLILYEAESAEPFASAAYRERLDRPTALTQRLAPQLRDVSRAILEVENGWRLGEGGWLMTAAFRERPDEAGLGTCLDALRNQPAAVAATYATAAGALRDAKVGTTEARATDSVERGVAACLLFEASADDGLEAAAMEIRDRFASAECAIHAYRMSFMLDA